MAIELHGGRTMNLMVNAGAMTTTSLAPGATDAERWSFISEGLSLFAGRALEIDPAVYASGQTTNLRNQRIAQLLDSYGRLHADGGVNPKTDVRVIEPQHCKHVLAAMATAGLYEHSGDWLCDVGLPGKSGVSGGIVTIAPGKGGFGVFSPPLDEAGNSVRGQLATRCVSEKLGLNIFASKPVEPAG